MKIEANVRIGYPREVAFRAYRDELPQFVPHLPNVKSIEVKETENNVDGVATRTRKLNVWRANVSIPSVAQAFLKPDMIAWDDHALWDEADWTCAWRTEPHFFRDRIQCAGKNRYIPDGDGVILEIRGDLTIDAKGAPGVPRLLASSVGAAVEKFVVALLVPNLTSVSKGLEGYLRSRR
jgi:hypothetical protein